MHQVPVSGRSVSTWVDLSCPVTIRRPVTLRGGPRLPGRSRVGKEAELQGFADFHQLVLSPPPRIQGQGGEHSASVNHLYRDVLDVRAEG